MIESWEMLSADGDGFEIQMTWKDPLKVSTQYEPDLLLMQLRLGNFTDSNGNQLPPSIVKTVKIPTQISEAEGKEVDSAGD